MDCAKQCLFTEDFQVSKKKKKRKTQMGVRHKYKRLLYVSIQLIVKLMIDEDLQECYGKTQLLFENVENVFLCALGLVQHFDHSFCLYRVDVRDTCLCLEQVWSLLSTSAPPAEGTVQSVYRCSLSYSRDALLSDGAVCLWPWGRWRKTATAEGTKIKDWGA